MEYWPSELFKSAIDLNILLEGEKLLLGAKVSPYPDIEKAAEELCKIVKLISTLTERFYNGNKQVMAEKLGVSEAAAEVMHMFDEQLDNNVLVRGDLLYTSDGWRLVEINTGSFVGGMYKASLPRLAGWQMKQDVQKRWVRRTIEHWDLKEKTIVIVAPPEVVKEYYLQIRVYANEFSAQLGHDVSVTSPCDLTWNGSELVYDGKKVDTVYCIFNEDFVIEDRKSYEAIIYALHAKAVICPMGPAFNLLSNKGVFALLWQLVDSDRLEPEEISLITKLIPRTVWLEDSNLAWALKNREDLILKPANGYSGTEVFSGAEKTSTEWNIILTDSLKNECRSYVLQNYCESLTCEVATTEKQDEINIHDARVVWGIYCWRGLKTDPPCRLKIDPGWIADFCPSNCE
ncbi:hypothetical protein GSU75_04521 [Pseudomonas savastanoi pv. phaseolicola]|nr:hypothetical protein [Pseudomonas savastanoi]MBN4177248.1 hypothetical protein [Pseudomonas savastanoi pv. phaseolicola]